MVGTLFKFDTRYSSVYIVDCEQLFTLYREVV